MNEDNKQFAKTVSDWWYRLQHDSGSSARLRHQSDIIGIQTVSYFYELASAVPDVNIDILAAIAMVLSHVKSDSKERIAVRMGRGTSNSNHTVSELRFNKLISMDLEELSREIIRVLPLIDNTASVSDLAVDLRYWDSDKKISKKQWLNDFYLADKR